MKEKEKLMLSIFAAKMESGEIEVPPTPTCILCKAPSDSIGVFLPDSTNAERIGTPKGKARFLIYGLCEECVEQPDAKGKAEAILFRELSTQ